MNLQSVLGKHSTNIMIACRYVRSIFKTLQMSELRSKHPDRLSCIFTAAII